MPIPEENNYTKSLPDREKYSSRRNGSSGGGGEQPLLKYSLNTKNLVQNNHQNLQSTALLSCSSTESEDDDGDDDNDENTKLSTKT